MRRRNLAWILPMLGVLSSACDPAPEPSQRPRAPVEQAVSGDRDGAEATATDPPRRAEDPLLDGEPRNPPRRDGDDDGDEGLGETTERPPTTPRPVPPTGNTPSTAEGPGCRISVHFYFAVGSRKKRLADLGPGIKLDPSSVPSIRIEPVLDGIGVYPGTLTLAVSLDGAPVPFTSWAGAPFTSSAGMTSTITLGELEQAPLRDALVELEDEFRRAGARYHLRTPAGVSATNPIRQRIVASATWRPRGLAPCTISEDLEITWTARQGTVGEPPSDDQGKNHLRGSFDPRGFTDSDGDEFVVAPVYHYWEVTDPYRCCEGDGPYQVIQFARVLFQDRGNRPPFRKGQPWALDIRESEKRRARADQTYDPTFTNDPRATNPGGSMVHPAPTGRSAIRQEDAPGMTRQRYEELVAAPEEVRVTWQFLAFLVCPPDVAEGENPAAEYLSDAKVCRVSLWEMVWTFPEGVGVPPVVDLSFEDVHPSSRNELCDANLAEWIRANGLRDAYDDPPPARANDLSEAEHDRLESSVERMRIIRP